MSSDEPDQGEDSYPVVVADDHGFVREALRRLFDSAGELTVVADVADGEAAVEATLEHHAAVLILDLNMKPRGGLWAIETLRSRGGRARIVICSGVTDPETRAQLEGMEGVRWCSKANDPDRLIAEVLEAAREAPVTPAGLAPPELSEREVAVLVGIVNGLSARQLGEALEVSPRTVESYLDRVRVKAGVKSRRALVRWARDHGYGKD